MKGLFATLAFATAVSATYQAQAKNYGQAQAQGQSYNYGNSYNSPQAQAQGCCGGQAQAQAVTTVTQHMTTTKAYGQYVAATAQANAAAATHQVTVGGTAGLVYTPNQIQANPGDVVLFTFRKSNHTVTQSTFGAPCIKSPTGVDSDFMPNADDKADGAPTFSFTVASKDPTWWYCKQGKHCQMGMVFAINPTAEKSFDAFKNNAMGGGTGASASAAAVPPVTTTSAAATVMGSQVAGSTANGACSCFCGAMAFPDPAWGVGAFGGSGGVVSMI